MCTSFLMDECLKKIYYINFPPGGRTNIYGLAVFETPIPGELLNSSSNLIASIEPIHENKVEESKTYHHMMVSTFYGITCFLSTASSWNIIELSLEKDIGQGEIISIDSFYTDKTGLVLAFTTVHPTKSKSSADEDGYQYFFRIYWMKDLCKAKCVKEFLPKLTERSQIIELPFTPTQITHTIILKNEISETSLILCGTDDGIHLYTQNSTTTLWGEEAVYPHFPLLSELARLESNILSLEIREFGEKKIIAAGCQNGILHLAIMQKDSTTGNFVQIENPTFAALFSPITSISMFSSRSDGESHDINMIVTCAIEQGIIYRSLDKKNFQSSFQLKECTLHDSVLCSHVMDVDLDGCNEILVGTYGGELMIFKLETPVEGEIKYKLVWQRSFAHPIYRITGLDLNQDGYKELIIVTQYGVHIFVPNLEKAKDQSNKPLNDSEQKDLESVATLEELQTDLKLGDEMVSDTQQSGITETT
ncbi:hypothetical protein G9A89_000804 [Geosiphon pyriformis]|nr:hypothetical protein G9A89_000804 [Geosiphon pyriformis]